MNIEVGLGGVLNILGRLLSLCLSDGKRSLHEKASGLFYGQEAWARGFRGGG
jgi:hypothetical protein